MKWWRSLSGKAVSKTPEPPIEPRYEPMTEGPREVEIGLVVRVFEDGLEVTDLVRSLYVRMESGKARRGTYVVDMGSGLRRTVEIGKD